MSYEAELGLAIMTGALSVFFGLLMGAIMWCSDSKIIAIIFCAMFVSIGTMIIIPRAAELNELTETQSVATEYNESTSFAAFESKWAINDKATTPDEF